MQRSALCEANAAWAEALDKALAQAPDGPAAPHERFESFWTAVIGLFAEHRRLWAVNIEAVTRMLSLPEPPTALFTGQNLITIGACRALRALGMENTVAMVGFDDFPLADLLRPGITVVAQDVIGLGRLAAETLFGRLDGDRSPFRTHVLPTRLIPRGSGEISPGAAR